MSFLDLSPSPEPPLVFKTGATRIPNSEFRKSSPMIEQEDEIMEAKILTHVPKHPIPSMQGAFAESFLESTAGLTSPSVEKIKSATERRQILLEQNASDETHAARWKLKPGQQFHEFWKLMAQISFGVYLLLNGIARDEDQVMKILQVHVDEVDEFLEITLDDFSAAQDDIEERLKYLKLPLKNVSTFDIMLEDRTFRRNIVEGNEKIEHIIARTALAMNDALKDVHQGANACQIFTEYLAAEQNNPLWKKKSNMRKVYEAMKGNVDGWCKALASLQTKGNHLDRVLVQLGSIIAEIDRRAGEVSRKTRFSSVPPSRSTTPSLNTLSIHDNRSSRQMHQSSSKGSKPGSLATPTNLPVGFETIPELEPDHSSDDSYLQAPELLLKPHTYTPVPSPGLPKSKSATKAEPATPTSPSTIEMSRHSSLRKRFSNSRKKPSILGEDSPKNSQLRQSVNSKANNNKTGDKFRDHQIPDILTPPSRGSDSANIFGFDEVNSRKDSPSKKNQNSITHQPHDTKHDRVAHDRTPTTSTRMPSHISVPCDNIQYQNSSEPSPLLTPMTIKIPNQQYFRPVNASPHSPLQRPWTASPSQNPLHAHPNSSSSNISNYSSYSHCVGNSSRFHSQTPNTMRNLPSAMGMSVQSEMTAKGLRKKRSMFGWLKEQFSLSEEEREAFEERRRHGEIQRMKMNMIDRDKAFENKNRYNGKISSERSRKDLNRDRRKV